MPPAQVASMSLLRAYARRQTLSAVEALPTTSAISASLPPTRSYLCASASKDKSNKLAARSQGNASRRAIAAPQLRPAPLVQRRGLATEVTRSSSFAKLTGEDIDALAGCLSSPSTCLLTTLSPASSSTKVSKVSHDELDAYNNDWMNKYYGKSQCVIKPKSAEEVSKVMKYCHSKNIAVVPQGGNTGLVGGSVPVFDEVVINLSNMNSIRSFDEVAGTLVCDAGCVLEVLDNHVAEKGYMMPLDLGAKGSCHLGGNVATNAGGLRFLRYGSLHGNVLGLEVVLADGTILDGLSTLRKDNTGFDLKQLFIGSEGTIGLITGISIITPRRPEAMNVAVFGLSSFEAVQKTFIKTKQHCGEILSAFEFMDKDAFELVQGHSTRPVKDPFEGKHPFYVLIETSGSKKDHDDEVSRAAECATLQDRTADTLLAPTQKLTGLLEELMESETIADGVLAQDESQAQGLWALRESVPEAAGKLGSVFKYDLSMPVEKMNELVEHMRKRFEEQGVMGKGIKTVVGYGHIGDGNLHINIVADSYEPKLENLIEPHIYEWTSKVK